MLKILIAVDGSAHANRTIGAIGLMAQSSLDLQAIFLSVDPGVVLNPLFSSEYTITSIKQLAELQKMQQDAILLDAVRQAKELGIDNCKSVSAYGTIASEIMRVADEENCDQIAMGTRGMGAVVNLFLGSVAQAVVHRSARPVLLVK